MSTKRIVSVFFALALVVALSDLSAAQSAAQKAAPAQTATSGSLVYDAEYILGPEDRISVYAVGMEEISDKPFRVGPNGYVDFPMLGRVKASGLTVEQLKEELVKLVAKEVRQPIVSIDILEFGSQPVSVIGAVGEPGVHQLRGRRTLAEVLSLAGGLRTDAGSKIKITRAMEWGPIPLPGAAPDASNQFTVAQVDLKTFLSAGTPADNIVIRPHDVITVPRAEVVYVVGAVRRPGGFPLNERDSITVLQAVALAEGLSTSTAAKDSRILRTGPGGERTEIEVDLKKVLDGKAPNVAMQAEDILFIPESTSKKVANRVLEATVATLSGIVIWRGF